MEEEPPTEIIEEAVEDNVEMLDFVASPASVQEEAVAEVKEAVIETPEVVEETPKGVEETPQEEVPTKVIPEVKEAAPAPPQETTAPLADKYKTKTGVVGERSEGINDVRKAISITDRFLYLKELFSNNQEAFNDALDEINKAESFADAVAYLAQFNWEDNETSQQFMKLVSRRF